jgi:hypothetical protein
MPDTFFKFMRYLFCRTFCGCAPDCKEPVPAPKPQVTVRIGRNTLTFQGDFDMKLAIGFIALAAAVFVDSKGNAAAIDGNPVWGSSNPDVLTVQDNGDGTATITPTGTLGTAQVTCEADVDTGEGVKPLTLLGDVEVIAGEAVGGRIDFTTSPAP